jgi:predicted alpha/beta superfamily hydrolase
MAQLTYTVTVPEGTNDCFIAGDMNGWTPHEMEKVSDTQYTITIPEATILHQYKYCCGPSVIHYVEKTSSGYDVANRSFQTADKVQSWAATWIFGAPIPITTVSGSAKSYFFRSKIVDDRNIEIWLPDNYNSSKKYSVLYMHDGQMLFDAAITWNKQAWNVDKTLEQLINQDSIQDVIVVGIDNNGAKREAEFFPQAVVENITEPEKSNLKKLLVGGAIADNYLDFIVNELKPYIDANYSTYTDQSHTFIGGSSLGGMISLYALCKYPNVFHGIFCLSTHWIGTFAQNEAIPTAVINYLSTNLPASGNHKIYFDHGTVGLDAMYAKAQVQVDSLVRTKGYTNADYLSLIFQGADHSENSWSARFNIPAKFILSNDNETIIKISSANHYLIYPNPVQNELYMKDHNFEINRFKVLNIRGEQETIRLLSTNKIDTSYLKPGIYFLCFENEVFKFIKN